MFGNENGLWKYYRLGLLNETRNYNGLKTNWKYYYENGRIKEEWNENDGQINGLCRSWHENGQLESEKNYKDGQLVDGSYKTWHENGQLKSEKNYEDGQLNGLLRVWHKNGQLWHEQNWKDGELISKKCWDEIGKEFICY